MEIWIESAKFITGQKLADQARLILKKDWLSDQEILGLCRLVNREEHTQRELSTRIETQYSENKMTAELRNTLILAQEDRAKEELI